jgi:uncharacterized membrane protein YebE (DUF533 family)
MWRAVVAMIHADGVVTPHELAFINDYIPDLNLSRTQLEMIADDLQNPKSVYGMYERIVTSDDRHDFFALARALSWCDGDFDEQEEKIIDALERARVDEENWRLMQESRDAIKEVELNETQWGSSKQRVENLFNFFNLMKIAS